MANYTGGPRYTRSLINERPGPRFNVPPNRNIQRNNLNDEKSQLNKHMNIAQQQQSRLINPTKTVNDTIISTPPTSNSPSIRNQTVTNSTNNTIDLTINSPNKSTKIPTTENISTEESSNTSIDNELTIKTDITLSDEEQRSIGQIGHKRLRSETNSQQQQNVFDSTTSLSQQQINERKTTQGGRCRLFIGNVPSDLTQDEFQLLFGKYGELVEYFVNPSRGFGFIKLSTRQLAEQAKYDLDGYVLRGKPLRIRFASQGATIKVKNLSPNVSNDLLKEAFEQYFGGIERAVVIVDDRGKSTGEGIIEFEKKPSAQKCLNECTERCFFITSELRPVVVEPWDIKDEEDGLPEKSLVHNPIYIKEREAKPRFAELNTIEHTIGLKWKELELQEKQLLEEVKRRMQYATEQLKIEIDQMYLEHQSQVLREELLRRQEDLRRIDELRSQEIDRRRNMIPMHRTDAYHNPFNITTGPISNVFHQNQAAANALQYNDFQQISYANSSPLIQQTSPIAANIDAAYTTNQVARGYGLTNARTSGDDFIQQQQQQQGFDRKRPRY
ncbi:unnamed protein product [Rotaria sordida]|uniref:RRM domain-containing protein n=1 Tax=Rotaria sordida TaxID=392033 RepID=A0A814X5X3_9BILA|nr:unnamed protein product [Rotaria sordida]CAF0975847.1 unnamed protein product [Rotaria sordida]CAF1173485.1 unnamed protein product [Rotaria sordida]CAF1189800.1 unnamed protein product [Rotaria sordida]CAF1200509.1 unnamed protein product [Rotaria sordida]